MTVGEGATGETLPQFANAIAAAPRNTAITQVHRVDADLFAMDPPFDQKAHGINRKRGARMEPGPERYFDIFFMYASSLSFS